MADEAKVDRAPIVARDDHGGLVCMIPREWLPALARHPAISSLVLENVERLLEQGGLVVPVDELREAIEADCRERQGESDASN